MCMPSADRISKFDTKILGLLVLTIASVASETIIGRVYLFVNPGPSSVQLNLALFTFGGYIVCGCSNSPYQKLKSDVGAPID